MKSFWAILISICFVTFIAISGCRQQRTHSATEKHYDLKGKVVLVEKDQHQITIAHEDIRDYMPAMTMPFTVGEDW
ncbi:MAG: copper-binding protein, partial [bacterium]